MHIKHLTVDLFCTITIFICYIAKVTTYSYIVQCVITNNLQKYPSYKMCEKINDHNIFTKRFFGNGAPMNTSLTALFVSVVVFVLVTELLLGLYLYSYVNKNFISITELEDILSRSMNNRGISALAFSEKVNVPKTKAEVRSFVYWLDIIRSNSQF